MPQEHDFNKLWGKLVAQSWADQTLRKRLISDPSAVMKEHGLPVPPGVQVKIVENTASVVYLPIPAKPSQSELSEAELNLMARAIVGNDSCSVTYFPKNYGENVERQSGGGPIERQSGGGAKV
jgi:hypothetical protein